MAIDRKYLTTKEVAEKLGVSEMRVRQFRQEGRLPAQQAGSFFVFDIGDVLRFAKQKRQTGRPKKI